MKKFGFSRISLSVPPKKYRAHEPAILIPPTFPVASLNSCTPNFSGGAYKLTWCHGVWPPELSKVSLSEKLSKILGVFRCFFFVDKISFPGQTVHFAIACHTYSESYRSSGEF